MDQWASCPAMTGFSQLEPLLDTFTYSWIALHTFPFLPLNNQCEIT